MNNREVAELSFPLLGLFGQDVVFESMLPFQLPRGGHFETLLGP
jgi:hypothetical protein